jgi:hypothetical protein
MSFTTKDATGTTISGASDPIASVNWPYVKLATATAGSTVPVDASAPLPVVQTGTPALATGASTAAAQATGNTSLSSIDGKTPVLGQALAAAAVPVVLTASQVTTLTPPTTLTVTNSGTFSVQNTASVAAGSALIGKVATDQTTHGTTDLVAADLTKVAGASLANGGLAGSQSIGGTGAAGAAITQNPLNLGAKGVSAEPAAVTAGQLSQLVTDLVGKLVVLPYANPESFVSGATAAMTATTSTSLLAAPAAGLRNYVTHLIATNSHATVGTFVSILDGVAGATVYSGYAAPAGGGFSITLPTPLRQPTAATALYCVDGTTGANVVVSASGYTGR